MNVTQLIGDPNSPAYQSPAYRAQLPALNLVDDCFVGQEAISAGRQKYLPKFEKESNKAYAARLANSTFWNAYRRTVSGLVGMVFRRNPVLSPNVPEQLRQQCENIDLMGTHFDVFSKEIFQAAINDGHAAILIDMPEPITNSMPNATLVDERNSRRPYWAFYKKAQIINWRTEVVGGVTALSQVTLSEYAMLPVGKYGQQMRRRYRILYPGGWELYEQGPTTITQIDGGTFSVQQIPLVVISTAPRAPLISLPPLYDLAYENLRFYRLQSALDHILTIANVPILAEIMGDNDMIDGQVEGGKLMEPAGTRPERVISPNSVYRIGHGGDLKFVEHNGNAIGKAQEELKSSKQNMAVLGLTILQSEQGGKGATATEEILEWEAETSELSGMARALEDGLEAALQFSAEYQSLDSGGDVQVNRDFTRAKVDGHMVTALAALVGSDPPGLSLETMWTILERGNLLMSDFMASEELVRIVAERKLLGTIRTTGALPGVAGVPGIQDAPGGTGSGSTDIGGGGAGANGNGAGAGMN